MRPARAISTPYGITFEIQDVTPELAARWLARDAELRGSEAADTFQNRRVMPSVVDKYAAAITDGTWQLNGESIKFAPDGRILDGQHRLAAIVAAARSMLTVVATNVPPESFETLDTGKGRRVADVLSIVGMDRPNRLAPALALLARYDWAAGVFSGYGAGVVTNTQALTTLREHPRIVESVAATDRAATLVGWGIAGALHYIFSEVGSRAEADTFFEQLGSGADLSKRSAVYFLRERALASKLSRTERLTRLRLRDLVIKAWLKRGEPIYTLRLGPGEEVALTPKRRRAKAAPE